MSATSNPNTPAPNAAPAPTPTPPYAPNPTDYTYTWGQISAGPQAIAFKAVMQLATLLTQIMDMYNQQAATQLNVQSQAALSASQATVQAAKEQSYETMCQAGSSFASAAVAVGGMAHTSMGTDTTKLDAATDNQKGLSDLQTSFTKVKLANPSDLSVSAGAVPPVRPPLPELTPDVQARMVQLKSGGESLVTAAKSQDPLDPSNPSKGTVIEAALAHMAQNGELDDFSKKLTSAQDNNAKAINDWHTATQTLQSQISMNQSLVNGLVSAGTQGGSAYCQQQAGQEQAVATLDNSNAQQAGSMASTSQGLISKFYDEELQAYSMLQQVAASATTRG